VISKRLVILGVCVFIAGARPALAQGAAGSIPQSAPDASVVSVRFGPFWMNQTIALTNLGIDNNVFNDPPDQNPKQDFTLTVVPQTDVWMSVGRTWVTGTLKEEITWYDKYASERSASNTYGIGWFAPLNTIELHAGSLWATLKDRPGYEIDERALRDEDTVFGSFEVRALSKTLFGVSVSRQKVNYDSNDEFQGVNLQQELNVTTTTYGVTMRNEVTPLTSITIAAQRSQDRFEYSPARNSDSTVLNGTVTFDPAALIKGSATIGYRDFKPADPGVPGYDGLTASANLVYTLLGSTRFGFQMLRDVEYSYDQTQPYYLETGFDGSIAQQIFGPVDVLVRGGLHHLAYRDEVGAVVLVTDRVDVQKTYGGGFGIHMGKNSRLGFNVDQVNRDSEVPDRRYSNLKFGTSYTYNF
jgi:hypothetical protein